MIRLAFPRTVGGLTLAVALAVPLLPPTLARAETVTLKIAHFLPPGAPAQKQVIEPWCATLAADSNNQIKCQIFPALQLGGTAGQLVDLAKNGVADIVWTAPGYSTGRFPVIEAMELPFIVRDAASGSRAVWDFFQAHAAKEFEAYKVLALHSNGGDTFHTAAKPIAGPDSMKGLKMRAPTRISAKTVQALGATPVNMPPAQVTEAIAKGVVDGAMSAWEVVTPTKLQEVTKFHADPPKGQPYYASTVLALLMNKARYAGLSPDLRAVIDRNSGAPLVDRFGAVWDGVIAATKTQVTAEGGAVVVQTPADYDAMRAAARVVEEDWVKEIGARGVDGAALVAAARALAAR